MIAQMVGDTGLKLTAGYVFGYSVRGRKPHIAQDPSPNGRFICSQPIHSRTAAPVAYAPGVCAMCRRKAGIDEVSHV